jgi:hypothetical protein
MDDPGQPSGIERAAQQGVDAFEAQQFPDLVPAPPFAPIGPTFQPGIPGIPPNDLFSRPHFMEGGWYVTGDRMSWWNGVMWVPGRPPGSSHAGDTTTPGSPTSPSAVGPLVGLLVGLAAMAMIAFIAWQAFHSMPTLTP